MSLFTELSEVLEGNKLTIVVMQKNGILTVSVMPDGVKDVQPLIATGTPAEMDEHLAANIKAPLARAKEIVINSGGFNKDLEEAATDKPIAKAKADASAVPKKEAKKPEGKKPPVKGQQLSLEEQIAESEAEENANRENANREDEPGSEG